MSAEALPAENVKPMRAVATRRTAAHSPMDIVSAALATGNVEMYREAVALMKDLDAFAAKKAFANALADAKAELPILKKNRLVDFANRSGDRTTYRHEDLAEVVSTVVPILSKFGLSHRYRLSGKPGEPVTVTCILSHRDGYAEENELSAGADQSGGKNAIQAVKSTVTYLERITLIASLGLAAGNDDDGRASEQSNEPEAPSVPDGSVTEDQAAFLREALEEKGAKETAFLQFAAGKGWFNGRERRLSHLPAANYPAAVNAIAAFKKA